MRPGFEKRGGIATALRKTGAQSLDAIEQHDDVGFEAVEPRTGVEGLPLHAIESAFVDRGIHSLAMKQHAQQWDELLGGGVGEKRDADFLRGGRGVKTLAGAEQSGVIHSS